MHMLGCVQGSVAHELGAAAIIPEPTNEARTSRSGLDWPGHPSDVDASFRIFMQGQMFALFAYAGAVLSLLVVVRDDVDQLILHRLLGGGFTMVSMILYPAWCVRPRYLGCLLPCRR